LNDSVVIALYMSFIYGLFAFARICIMYNPQ